MKRKLFNTLMPALVGIATVAPACSTITSCQNKEENITIDNKSVTSKNSYTNYKFNMKNKPDDGKVHVTLKDQNENLVRFYDDDTTNSSATEVTVTVADDGSFELPIGLVLAGTSATDSKFNLEFSYTKDGSTTSQTVSDLGFGYNLEYYDLKQGEYEPKIQALTPGWTQTEIGDLYETAVLNNPDIFVDDARYSTAHYMKKALDDSKITGINKFKANFNDIYRVSDGGLHLHMTYDIEGSSESYFKMEWESDNATNLWEFKNFQCQFSLETISGYNFSSSKHENVGDDYEMNIIDTETVNPYTLIGKIKGSFEWSHSGSDYKQVTFTTDQILDEDSNTNEVTDLDAASILSSGILCLTYNFTFGTGAPQLQLLSPYAKNAAVKS